ncbi:MAG: hypothetical protein COA57_10340 [Flavobacteriales bacterium]|nr:class I SAM-dependent methyltransferase [Bacteroidales bacterium AH-315-I05]PCJ83878.1 MAG: hypothetical protein COA57_10340 [Flavobacteriales bacterium]
METTKEFFNEYAHDFDAIYGTKNDAFNKAINFFFRKSMKLRFLKSIESIPDSASSVLDVGCGPGHYCSTLAKKGVQFVHGVDFSEEMIEIAKQRKSKEVSENVLKFEVADILKFHPERKYDYIIMMGFIEYFENPEELLKKVINIANKKIFISFPNAKGMLALQRRMRYKQKCPLYMYTRQQISDLMMKTNLHSFSIEKIDRDYFVSIDL